MPSFFQLDLNTFRCVSNDISTDEVILTEERIKHIHERHPDHYLLIQQHLEEALKKPDYIFKDKKPDTGLVLKYIEVDDLRFQMVVRIHTPADDPTFKNSILSAWIISKKRWDSYVRNKKILYQKE